MPDNTLQFRADLERFARRLDAEIDQVIRKVALDIFTATVKRTPVATGALRASWQIGVNTVSTDKINVTGGSLSASGAQAIADSQKKKISSINAGDTVNITNNQPYAIVVEYGMFRGSGPKITSDGYSTQAPQGMLRKSIQEVESGINSATQSFNRLRG